MQSMLTGRGSGARSVHRGERHGLALRRRRPRSSGAIGGEALDDAVDEVVRSEARHVGDGGHDVDDAVALDDAEP